VNHAAATNPFMEEVVRCTAHGDRLHSCLQCGSCGGSCPNGADMEFSPRAIFALIAAGERDKVLRANTQWVCVSCYACTVRCPKEIPITDIMYTLKRKAVAAGTARDGDAVALARKFNQYIVKYGRSFEFGLASLYYLTRRPGSMLGQAPFGLKMLRSGRLHLKPKKIKALPQLRAIIDKAHEIGGEL
jgi:heterodisulfide reductase subunit C